MGRAIIVDPIGRTFAEFPLVNGLFSGNLVKVEFVLCLGKENLKGSRHRKVEGCVLNEQCTGILNRFLPCVSLFVVPDISKAKTIKSIANQFGLQLK